MGFQLYVRSNTETREENKYHRTETKCVQNLNPAPNTFRLSKKWMPVLKPNALSGNYKQMIKQVQFLIT